MGVRRICIVQNAVHNRPVWRELANRVGICGISREQSSLTPATTEIDFSLRTTPTWLRHPFGSTESVKALRFAPDPIEIACANIFESQIGNCRRSSRTREDVAD